MGSFGCRGDPKGPTLACLAPCGAQNDQMCLSLANRRIQQVLQTSERLTAMVLSAARLPATSAGPWLCVPAFRPVCLCRGSETSRPFGAHESRTA